MHLPWKKHGVSRLLAHLQSPSNRGRSLVVQTGFPTSLIDLFVKNRDRLRKNSKKHGHNNKHSRRRGIDRSDVCPTRVSPPPPPTVSLSSSTRGVLMRPNKGEFGGVESIRAVGDCDDAIKRVDSNESYAGRVFLAVLKTFFVVALALSTKKLVVGITLSAFVLLLLEYVGNHVDVDVGVFLKPCERWLDLIRRGMSFFWRLKASRRLEKSNDSKRLVLQESPVFRDTLKEIEGVGSSNFEEEIAVREEGSDSGRVIGETEWSCVDTKMKIGKESNEHRGEEALLYLKHQSRSHRIKSKIIKKFVPKKLRALNKKKKSNKGRELEEDEEESSETSSYLSIEEQEDDCGEHKLGGEINVDDEESQITKSCELLEAREKAGRGREKTSGCLMLVLIVLVGLVGGQILALMLTVVWCLVSNLAWNRRAYTMC